MKLYSIYTNLFVRQLETELFHARLDGIPSRETVSEGACMRLLEPGYTVNSNKPNGYIASQTEIFRLEDFVRARVVEDGLGMDTCLVRESAVSAAGALSCG